MSEILEAIDERGVATITLNRPERHNAFDDAVIAALTGALRRLAADAAVRIVVLASSGRSFSAGADLEWMRRMATYSHEANLADANALAALMQTLDSLPKPTMALVQGAAFGGGVGLVASCDIVLASERAVFCLSEVKLGLTPATISPYVVRAMSARHARRYFQTAEIFGPAEAHAMGLVHEVVPAEALAETAERIIDALLQGAPGAQAEAKALVTLCEETPIGGALMAETARRIATQRTTAEGREGVGAFLAKRKPNWQVKS
ncbi:MAG: enoyl-CoA hydratase-related protein [Rhodospirillales bacterium]